MIRPARGLCLVRPVETEQTLPGGRIVIPDDARAKFASHQVQIVAVGLPEECEDREECQRPEWAHAFDDPPNTWVHFMTPEVGAWAIVQPRSFIPAGHDGEKLYLVRQRDVLAVFVQESERNEESGSEV